MYDKEFLADSIFDTIEAVKKIETRSSDIRSFNYFLKDDLRLKETRLLFNNYI